MTEETSFGMTKRKTAALYQTAVFIFNPFYYYYFAFGLALSFTIGMGLPSSPVFCEAA